MNKMDKKQLIAGAVAGLFLLGVAVWSNVDYKSNTSDEVRTTQSTNSIDNKYEYLTDEQIKAIERAVDYIFALPFSREGLISQLQYEGFSRKVSEDAVDSMRTDWYEQAVKTARLYMQYNYGLSMSQLIDQLECDGFTTEQSEYAASIVFSKEEKYGFKKSADFPRR